MKKNTLLFLIGFAFVACDELFDYSPYQANVPSNYKNQTLSNIHELIEKDTFDGPIRVAAITDTHFDYGDLKDAVKKINSMDSIDFAIHVGDLTDRGLLLEYELVSDYLNELNVPFFTAVGNHDYLSNGGDIYSKVFGYFNYAFNYKNVKFIVFDATTWESKKKPQMDWLEYNLQQDLLPKVIVSHIPPWDGQYSEKDRETYKRLSNNKNAILSVNGHTHNFYHGNKLATEHNFLVLSNIRKREICLLTINQNKTYSFEQIPF